MTVNGPGALIIPVLCNLLGNIIVVSDISSQHVVALLCCSAFSFMDIWKLFHFLP